MAQATRVGRPTFSDYFQRLVREAIMWALFAVALFLLACLASYSPQDPGWTHIEPRTDVRNLGGPFGAWFADVALSLFGYFSYLLPIAVAWISWLTLRGMDDEAETRVQRLAFRLFGFLLTLSAGSTLAGIHLLDIITPLPYGIGGGVGQLIGTKLTANFHQSGATLLLMPLLLAGITFFSGLSWLDVLDGIGWLILTLGRIANGSFQWLMRPAISPGTAFPPIRDGADEVAGPAPPGNASLVDAGDLIILASPSQATSEGDPPRSRAMAEPLSTAKLDPATTAPTPNPARLRTPRPQPDKSSVGKTSETGASKAGEAMAAESKTTETKSSDGTQLPLAPLGLEGTLPPLELLDEARRSGRGYTKEQLDELSRQVEIKLADFGVVVEVVAVHPGPVVTLFEMMPAPGTKASKITGLSKDIARALSTISVRVVEVIPGKSVIGLEIPNKFRETVALREILDSNAYRDAKSPLTLALGTDISGHPVVADLARMPHALIAGTTGSGKSVAINAMILSLVYKSAPRDVRLIMVDPKMLELSVYEGIPHLLTPVVTDMKEAANALRWCVAEMERRYKLMARLGVRNIGGFNRKIAEALVRGEPIPDPLYNLARELPLGMAPDTPPALEHLPYIVVIIDELADMMMVVGKKVEELIARLAQKARASGIHLLLATQRPSVDVLTGLIKANIPTRMAFQVSSRIDSRTILDQMGAEHLLGNGDMLYLPPGTSIPQRIHGAFVDDHEVHQVVEFLREQGEPDYIDTILMDMGDGIPGIDADPRMNGGDLEDQDPLFDEAVQIVVESRRASISGVQRRLKIGYNRAARMIEEMERIGIVGPAETNGNREVLAPPPAD